MTANDGGDIFASKLAAAVSRSAQVAAEPDLDDEGNVLPPGEAEAAINYIDAAEDKYLEEVMARPGNDAPHHLDLAGIGSIRDLAERFKSKWWRLNNLYYIIDKFGNKVLFKCNWQQKFLYQNRWWRNIILKARQIGFTTFIDLFILDECLFHDNLEALIIAHNLIDAQKIFRRKIKFPYDNLPQVIKDIRANESSTKSEMHFSNKSSLSVGLSGRSGTYNLLHISEFGKICAKFPFKAEEIVTGALPSAHAGSMAFIESTAEGRDGYFFNYCEAARKLDAQISNGEAERTRLDWKFFFFPWWGDPGNRLDVSVPVTQKVNDYFKKLKGEFNLDLELPQKWWYIKTLQDQGDRMKQEHPSSPEEAFEASIEGAYFASSFQWLYENKRITDLPIDPKVDVDTWWDLGYNDIMAIWFTQTIGLRVHVVDYLEHHTEGLKWYQDRMKEKGYKYGLHFAPHDVAQSDWLQGRSRWAQAKELFGVKFEKVNRTSNKQDAINAARRFFSCCWFDKTRCDEGIKRLQNYRREWDDKLGTYKSTPLHDKNSNGADAFMTLACGHSFKPKGFVGSFLVPVPPDNGWA